MISTRRWYLQLMLLASLLIVAGSAAFASVPNPPVLRVTQDPLVFGQTMTTVYVTWNAWDHQTTPPPTSYIVYRTNGIDSVNFDSIATIPAPDVNDSNSQVVEFADHVSATTVGFYLYHVVSINADGSSAPSNNAFVYISPIPAELHFTSDPPGRVAPNPGDSITVETSIGQTYTYDADAVASNNGQVTYTLYGGPNGMTIDANTGLLQWTPTSAQTVYVRIMAELQGDKRVVAYQNFQIRVRSCAIPHSIYGRVVDGNGNGIDNVNVNVIPLEPNSTVHTVTTQSGGYYNLAVDAGSYLMRIDGIAIIPQWYNGAYERNLASELKLGCGDSTLANFTAIVAPSETSYLVTGKVVDRNGNKPIPNAVVEFVGYNINVPDSVKWEYVHREFIYTNANGEYQTSLSNQYRYTAYVSAVDTLTENGDFTRQYYNLTNDPTQATVFTVDHNLTGIDFQLDKLEKHDNMVSGYVRDSIGNQLPAIVVAYRVTSQGHSATVEPVQSIEAAGGYFYFHYLTPGDYVFYAIPLNRINVPGYKKGTAFATLTWQDADQFRIDGNTQIQGMEIILEWRAGVHGSNRLSGTVTTNTGHTIKVERTPQGTLPVAGAMVAAVDQSTGVVAAYTYSNTDGHFSIEGLAAGQYRVVVDRVGYGVSNDVVALSGDSQTTSHDVKIESLAVSSVPNATTGAAMELALYPNPASSQISLRLAGAQGAANVVVTNVQGEAVLSAHLDQVSAGTYVLDARGLASGIYFVRLTTGNVASQAAVRIVR